MNKSYLSRRDSIVLSAIEIINDSGLQGLSTKEIANRQGVGESSLYRHYKSKDDIIMAVLEYYAKFDDAIINSIASNEYSAKKKILSFIRSYVEYYENYPSITALVHSYEILKHDEATDDVIKRIFSERTDFLRQLIIEAQSNKELDSIFSPEELTDIIWGYTLNIILKWRMDGHHFPLKETILATVEKFLQNC